MAPYGISPHPTCGEVMCESPPKALEIIDKKWLEEKYVKRDDRVDL